MFEITDQSIQNLQDVIPDVVVNMQPENPLTLILPLIVAMVVSMVLIPVMVRLAPVFNLIDEPDPRKVHARPVPRVGGIGIFFGVLVSILIFMPIDRSIAAFLAGGTVLFIFGVLDDSFDLGHYVKFIGQFIAVGIVIFWGDVYVTQLPFLQQGEISGITGRLFTLVAMVGMINAINHSDGLDGLAGGESLLSLFCIAWLSYLAGGASLTLLSFTMIGALFGFVRYNTHPAVVFMGDSGSQFIGFALGFLTVILTQEVNPALSPALPALILGLPIADIIVVFARRIYGKMNWFRASRNHIHHRLLDLGLYHYESVVVIYLIQTVLVISAVLMQYESDGAVIGLYSAVVMCVFAFLYLAESRQWKFHARSSRFGGAESTSMARLAQGISVVSYWGVSLGLSAYLLTGALLTTNIPPDFTFIAMMLCGLMVVRLVVESMRRFLPLRALCYITIAFIVYLFSTYQPQEMIGADPVTYTFFASMGLFIATAIRFSEKGAFNLTPTDFLVLIAVASLALLSSRGMVDSRITAITLKIIILFYGSELVINRMRFRWNLFTISTLSALAIISARGMGFLEISV